MPKRACKKCFTFHPCIKHAKCLNDNLKKININGCEHSSSLFEGASSKEESDVSQLKQWINTIISAKKSSGIPDTEPWDIWVRKYSYFIIYISNIYPFILVSQMNEEDKENFEQLLKELDIDADLNAQDSQPVQPPNNELLNKILESIQSLNERCVNIESVHQHNAARSNENPTSPASIGTAPDQEPQASDQETHQSDIESLVESDCSGTSREENMPMGSFSPCSETNQEPEEWTDNIDDLLKNSYPLPEEAHLIHNFSEVMYKKSIITKKEIMIHKDTLPSSPWLFSVLPTATISGPLLGLINAAKQMPKQQSQKLTFSKAFKFLDKTISQVTGWSEPNHQEHSIQIDNMELIEPAHERAKKILTGENIKQDHTKLYLVSDKKKSSTYLLIKK